MMGYSAPWNTTTTTTINKNKHTQANHGYKPKLVGKEGLVEEAEELLELLGGGRGLGSVEGGAHLLHRLVDGLHLPDLSAHLHHGVVDVVSHAVVLWQCVEQEVQSVG